MTDMKRCGWVGGELKPMTYGRGFVKCGNNLMIYDKGLLEKIKAKFVSLNRLANEYSLVSWMGLKVIDCTKYMETSPPITPIGTGKWHERYWYLIKAAFRRAWREMREDMAAYYNPEDLA